MPDPSIAFICPTHNAGKLVEYTRSSLETFFETTPMGLAIVVDDASRNWPPRYETDLRLLAEKYPGSGLHIKRHTKPGGLTRSWNAGLSMAERLGVEYAIPANNDILFTPGWSDGLIRALASGYNLVGPVSNAPGVTAKGRQDVKKHLPEYELTDAGESLQRTAAALREKHSGKVLPSKVNGFFLMAAMSSWVKNKYSRTHFFRPVNRHMPSGRVNPDPLNCGNEDEWQSRAGKLGMKFGIALDSFIFHYRSVTRGSRHCKGAWFRKHE